MQCGVLFYRDVIHTGAQCYDLELDMLLIFNLGQGSLSWAASQKSETMVPGDFVVITVTADGASECDHSDDYWGGHNLANDFFHHKSNSMKILFCS